MDCAQGCVNKLCSGADYVRVEKNSEEDVMNLWEVSIRHCYSPYTLIYLQALTVRMLQESAATDPFTP